MEFPGSSITSTYYCGLEAGAEYGLCRCFCTRWKCFYSSAYYYGAEREVEIQVDVMPVACSLPSAYIVFVRYSTGVCDVVVIMWRKGTPCANISVFFFFSVKSGAREGSFSRTLFLPQNNGGVYWNWNWNMSGLFCH